MPHLDPLTEQQLLVIGNLRLSSRQAEEALSQGLEQLHRSLSDTVTGDSLSDGVDVGNYMGHMALALGKLANLEGFVRQVSTSHSPSLPISKTHAYINNSRNTPLSFKTFYKHTNEPKFPPKKLKYNSTKSNPNKKKRTHKYSKQNTKRRPQLDKKVVV